MDLSGSKVTVVGLGKSGAAAARLCCERGADVIGLDEAPTEAIREAETLRGFGVEVRGGGLDERVIADSDLVVVSPGVPQRDVLLDAEKRGQPVIGELELASRFVDAPIVLVGGTNGKSTVTGWTSAMFEADGRKVFSGGNYGTPLCDAVDADFDVLVVEISSFQAERVPTLHARVHALLNISEDHLDRYPSFEAYARAKGNPFESMGADDVAVIPQGDEACAAQAGRGGARAVTFGSGGDVAVDGDAIVDRLSGRRYPTASIKLRGAHNLSNACASVAVVAALDADPAAIERGLAGFGGLDHRHELVAEIDGVRFYDDSKATNVGAAVAALEGLDEGFAVLIAGGRDKQGAYEPLVEALRKRGRALVLIGEAADRIAAAAHGVLPIERAASMQDAVERGLQLAEPGDAVLLSPACSSFDMFASYKARGDAFASAVRTLGDDA